MFSSWRGRALVLMAAWAFSASAAEEESAEIFSRDVRPILTAHCVECHGPTKQENGLRLDFGAAILRGGDSGPAVVAGKPAESLFVQALLGTSDSVSRMPLKKPPLANSEVAAIRRWIESGAKLPADRVVETKKSTHWAFQRPLPSELPPVVEPTWPKGPIDRFILARLENEGLAHSTAADRATLIRRVALDLIGLPPSPNEVDAFVT